MDQNRHLRSLSATHGLERSTLLPRGYARPYVSVGLHNKIPSFLGSHFEDVETNSYIGAPVSDKKDKWPMLIMSHGLKGFEMPVIAPTKIF